MAIQVFTRKVPVYEAKKKKSTGVFTKDDRKRIVGLIEQGEISRSQALEQYGISRADTLRSWIIDIRKKSVPNSHDNEGICKATAGIIPEPVKSQPNNSACKGFSGSTYSLEKRGRDWRSTGEVR